MWVIHRNAAGTYKGVHFLYQITFTKTGIPIRRLKFKDDDFLVNLVRDTSYDFIRTFQFTEDLIENIYYFKMVVMPENEFGANNLKTRGPRNFDRDEVDEGDEGDEGEADNEGDEEGDEEEADNEVIPGNEKKKREVFEKISSVLGYISDQDDIFNHLFREINYYLENGLSNFNLFSARTQAFGHQEITQAFGHQEIAQAFRNQEYLNALRYSVEYDFSCALGLYTALIHTYQDDNGYEFVDDRLYYALWAALGGTILDPETYTALYPPEILPYSSYCGEDFLFDTPEERANIVENIKDNVQSNIVIMANSLMYYLDTGFIDIMYSCIQKNDDEGFKYGICKILLDEGFLRNFPILQDGSSGL